MSGSPLTGGRKRRGWRARGARRHAPVLVLVGLLAIAFILLWTLLERGCGRACTFVDRGYVLVTNPGERLELEAAE